MPAERLLAFHLARHRWAFSLADLGGVIEMPALRPLPGLQPPFLGLAQRHGRIVTVLDLPGLLHDVPSPDARRTESLLLLAPPRGHLALRLPAELRLVVPDSAGGEDAPLRRIDLARLLASVEPAAAGA